MSMKIAEVVAQMETSMSALNSAAGDIQMILADKADASDLQALQSEIRQHVSNPANTPDNSGALSVQRCLSCNQSLQRPSSLEGAQALHNRFTAAPPSHLLPPKSRPQSAMAPPGSAGLFPKHASKPWPSDIEPSDLPLQLEEDREIHQIMQHRHERVNRVTMRPSSSMQHRSRGPQARDRPLTALEHRQHQPGRVDHLADRSIRSTSAQGHAERRPTPVHTRQIGTPQAAPDTLCPEGVVSTTMPFTKRTEFAGIPTSAGSVRKSGVGGLPRTVSAVLA